jgi:hypothetical protein
LTFATRTRGKTVANVKSTAPGSVVQERVEHECLPAAFRSGRRRFASVRRIEHAWLARRPCGVGIGLCRGGRRRRCTRRQIERAFTSAAPERKHGRAQKDDGPPGRCWAVVANHDKIPNAGGTIQRLPCSGETSAITKLQRNPIAQPNFRSFSSRLSQPRACARTFFGAVPP